MEYLAYLFAGRGDFANADKYIEAMRDDMRRADAARMITHFYGYFDYAARDADKIILFKAD